MMMYGNFSDGDKRRQYFRCWCSAELVDVLFSGICMSLLCCSWVHWLTLIVHRASLDMLLNIADRLLSRCLQLNAKESITQSSCVSYNHCHPVTAITDWLTVVEDFESAAAVSAIFTLYFIINCSFQCLFYFQWICQLSTLDRVVAATCAYMTIFSRFSVLFCNFAILIALQKQQEICCLSVSWNFSWNG